MSTSVAPDGATPQTDGRHRTMVLPSGGGWLRIMLALACVVTMIAVFVHGQQGGTNFIQWMVMVVLTYWVVRAPGSSGPNMLLIGALTLRVFADQPVLDGRLIALVVLLPLVHQLAALAAVVPLRSSVQVAALLPTAMRYLGVVLVTVLGLLTSHWLGWW